MEPISFWIVAAAIDYSSFTYNVDPLPEYYDAKDVMENTDDNSILSDMTKGFVALAVRSITGYVPGGVSEEAGEARTLRGVRKTQGLSLDMLGGDISTTVYDQGEFDRSLVLILFCCFYVSLTVQPITSYPISSTYSLQQPAPLDSPTPPSEHPASPSNSS